MGGIAAAAVAEIIMAKNSDAEFMNTGYLAEFEFQAHFSSNGSTPLGFVLPFSNVLRSRHKPQYRPRSGPGDPGRLSHDRIRLPGRPWRQPGFAGPFGKD